MAFPVYASGQAAAGTLLQRGSAASPETFVTVARVGNIKLDSKRRSVETTSHSTVPSGGGPVFATHIPTIIDGGMLTFDLFVKTDSPADRQLVSDFRNGTTLDWRIVQPDSLQSVIDCNGFFTSFSQDSPVAGVTKIAAAIQTTGPIYWYE